MDGMMIYFVVSIENKNISCNFSIDLLGFSNIFSDIRGAGHVLIKSPGD
jgi:hypothetical protein